VPPVGSVELITTPVDDRFSDDMRELRRREEPVGDPWLDG
jgi:hypothetical protein